MRSLTVTSGNFAGTPGGRAAFSLVEVMIAIGILGIGMTMIAAIFPAAIKQNEISANSTLGKIICENGLTLGRIALTADTAENKNTEVNSATLDMFADESKNNVIAAEDQHYPSGETDSRLGFVLLARKAGKGYQLVTVAYRKANAGNTVTADSITCSVNAGSTDISGATNLRVGSPLIDKDTGQYATIVATNSTGTTGTLDQSISTDVTSAYVIRESGEDRRSPAIATMATYTGLWP